MQLDTVQLKLYRVALTQLVERLYRSYKENGLKAGFERIKQKMQWDRQREGAQYLVDFCTRKQLSEALIKWLRSIYEEEIQMQQSIEVLRE